ncbi:hypothetical protein RvY_06531-1 [Ramazzottius varieornatus]|uniref:Uncharacterized protein n=1 Tax=Ramazzottius varieornatus TaxID=947166 RepID=A0A1D1UYX3_RAMVA|nr:hypothetical protein RvY_06531-1 [Ramazzottius varieornatus]
MGKIRPRSYCLTDQSSRKVTETVAAHECLGCSWPVYSNYDDLSLRTHVFSSDCWFLVVTDRSDFGLGALRLEVYTVLCRLVGSLKSETDNKMLHDYPKSADCRTKTAKYAHATCTVRAT